MLRSIGAIVLGFVVAFVLFTVFQMVSTALMPEGIPMDSTEDIQRAMEAGQIPFISMLLVVIGYVVGSFAAGWVAEKIAHQWPMRQAWIVGIGLTLLGIANLFMIPHPLWMTIAVLAAYLPPAYLGGRLALRGAVAAPPPEPEASTPPA